MSILQEIAKKTIERVQCEQQNMDFQKVKNMAENTNGRNRPFLFEENLRKQGMNFICEVKKASPSKGVIAEKFPYTEIAQEYEQAGAAAISVLTEPYYFKGSDVYLQEIANVTTIPLLRKDFVIDPYMIYQAKVIGADAVLLICSLLSTETLKEYIAIADSLGLSSLVEAHTQEEVESALEAKARVIGVNNRNLNDFTVDIYTSERLRSLVPQEVVFVSESGIKTPTDVQRLHNAGVNACLIGETLMRSQDKAACLKSLRGMCVG